MPKSSKLISELDAELEEIISWFESSDIKVDEAAQKYEQALALIKELEVRLNEIEVTIKKIKQKFS